MHQPEAMNHHVEWFVSGDCPRCGPLLDAVETRCRSLPLVFRRVPVLSALDRAVALGILRAPALVFDDRLLLQGAFTFRQAIKRLRVELHVSTDYADR